MSSKAEAKQLKKIIAMSYGQARKEIEERIAKDRRRREEKKVLAVLKSRARKHPQTYAEIGAWSGIHNDTVQAILTKFRKQGLVQYVPLKKCETCKRLLATGSGWIYLG